MHVHFYITSFVSCLYDFKWVLCREVTILLWHNDISVAYSALYEVATSPYWEAAHRMIICSMHMYISMCVYMTTVLCRLHNNLRRKV